MDGGLGIASSMPHESSDAGGASSGSRSVPSEASHGGQERIDRTIAPEFNSSAAAHDQTTTPQSSPSRNRGESRSPGYHNNDSFDAVSIL